MDREVVIMTPEQVELRFELAGIGSRFIAILVDSLLQALIAIVIWVALALGGVVWLSQLEDVAALSPWIIAVIILVYFVLFSGYFLYFEAARNGQTPGKKYADIRVIRDTGHPIDFRAALLRNVMRIVDSLPGAYGIGIISAFFSPQYRRLGDYVAGTLVVKVGRVPDAVTASPKPASTAYTAVAQTSTVLPTEAIPNISRISKDDYRTLRHFLNRRSELQPFVARDLAMNIAQPLARTLAIEPSQIGDPLAFLEAVGREWERMVIH